MNKEPTQEQIIEGCPFALAAGSYYAPLPWSECKKTKKSMVTGNYEMCAVDAGRECPYTTNYTLALKEEAVDE